MSSRPPRGWHPSCAFRRQEESTDVRFPNHDIHVCSEGLMPSSAVSPDVIDLRIPSRLELLELLDRVAMSICSRMELDDETSSQVAMSVIEAGTNAIQHAHGRDASKDVDVRFTIYPDRIEIDVYDKGPGFDLGSINGDAT